MDVHIESGSHPADLLEIGVILRNGHPNLDATNYPPLGINEQPSKIDLVNYGHWLIKAMDPPHRFKERVLNRDILNRASRMGIGYKLTQIRSPKAFDTLRSYYECLEIEDTHRINNYYQKLPDWDVDDFIKYIKKVSKELDKKPTRNDFEILAKTSAKKPSPHLIASRLGSLRRGLELAGYPDIHSWDLDDFINWGVKVRRANEGDEIRTTGIEYLSFLKRGPSDLTIRKKFGSIENFQMLVNEAYIQDERTRQEDKENKLALINDRIEKETIPYEVFLDADSEEERIVRYSRYIVLDEFFSDNLVTSKVTIATLSTKTAKKIGFVGSIRKLNQAIRAGEIESVALYLGAFDDIWPMDDFMENFKVPTKNKSNPKWHL